MSDKINAGGPAFPQFTQDPWQRPIVTGGMSLRDYFAGQALIALVANGVVSPSGGIPTTKVVRQGFEVAHAAYQYADAMIARKEVPRE